MNCIKLREELEKDLLKARIYYSDKIDVLKEKKRWWKVAPFSQTDINLIKYEFRLDYVENMYRMISKSSATTVSLDLWEFDKVYEYEENK